MKVRRPYVRIFHEFLWSSSLPKSCYLLTPLYKYCCGYYYWLLYLCNYTYKSCLQYCSHNNVKEQSQTIFMVGVIWDFVWICITLFGCKYLQWQRDKNKRVKNKVCFNSIPVLNLNLKLDFWWIIIFFEPVIKTSNL